jgi:chromosome segregation ATPase
MSDITIEQLKAENEALKTELKAVKTELKNAKTEATKATNKLAEVQKELDALKATVGEGSDNTTLKEENEAMKLQLAEQDKLISELRSDSSRKNRSLLTDDMLKAKAKKIIEQDGLQEVFITLKGHCFPKEATAIANAKNHYKIAQLLDGKVVLKDPK